MQRSPAAARRIQGHLRQSGSIGAVDGGGSDTGSHSPRGGDGRYPVSERASNQPRKRYKLRKVILRTLAALGAVIIVFAVIAGISAAVTGLSGNGPVCCHHASPAVHWLLELGFLPWLLGGGFVIMRMGLSRLSRWAFTPLLVVYVFGCVVFMMLIVHFSPYNPTPGG